MLPQGWASVVSRSRNTSVPSAWTAKAAIVPGREAEALDGGDALAQVECAGLGVARIHRDVAGEFVHDVGAVALLVEPDVPRARTRLCDDVAARGHGTAGRLGRAILA